MLQQVFYRPERELRVVTGCGYSPPACVSIGQIVGDVDKLVEATLRTSRLAAIAQGIADCDAKEHAPDAVGEIGTSERHHSLL